MLARGILLHFVRLNRDWMILLVVFSLFGCGDPGTVPVPVYPDGPLMGASGPEPMGGWTVATKEGIIDGGDYFNTGGSFYISIEDSAFVKSQATQVYLNRDPEHPDRYGWYLYEDFRVSDRFIYIEDPSRAYKGFGYVFFIYLKYRGN